VIAEKIYWCRFCFRPHSDQDERDEHEGSHPPSFESLEVERAVADQLREEAFNHG
jgi:hypothetical protein